MANRKTNNKAGGKATEIVAKLVDILTPLSAEERQRVLSASLTLLGDEPPMIGKKGAESERDNDAEVTDLPARAKVWVKQNKLSVDEIQQVFHLADGTAEVIATEIPGKSDKEKTHGVYVLQGIANLLATGNPTFDDKSARTLCKSSGCFNSANHSAYMSDHGNEISGSKGKGWTLTAPGLKRGVTLIKELAKE